MSGKDKKIARDLSGQDRVDAVMKRFGNKGITKICLEFGCKATSAQTEFRGDYCKSHSLDPADIETRQKARDLAELKRAIAEELESGGQYGAEFS